MSIRPTKSRSFLVVKDNGYVHSSHSRQDLAEAEANRMNRIYGGEGHTYRVKDETQSLNPDDAKE